MSAVLGWFLASLAVVAVTVLIVVGLAAILTCAGGTKARRAQARPTADERDYGAAFAPLDNDATTYDARWDEHRPGAGPRRGEKEAL